MIMRLQMALALALALVAHQACQTRAVPIGNEDYLSDDLSLEEINRLIAQREASAPTRPRPPVAATSTSTTAAPEHSPDGVADGADLETINRLIAQRDANQATGGAQQPGPQRATPGPQSSVTPPAGRHPEADDPKYQARLLEMREQCRLAAEVRSHGPTRAPVHSLPRPKKSPVQTVAKLDGNETEKVLLSSQEMETRRLMRERCAKAAERRARDD